ncbi:MAG: hypothetical protein RL407_608 [Bacteroidota bacterium]|jgi:peptidoglycan/xylan/chitin deacetylase (PgdA/CDA1 family)
MRLYRIPFLLEQLFPNRLWEGPRTDRSLYLTFDDGPVPGITDFVLEQLAKRSQVATFFMVGDNARKHPSLLREVVAAGHGLGNHTQHHLAGWKVSTPRYLLDIQLCDEALASVLGHAPGLFRPPYGWMSPYQASAVAKEKKIVMWSLLGRDFDPSLSSAQCLQGICKRTSSGKILVLHDQEKTLNQVKNILPDYLDFLIDQGFTTRALPIF